MKISLVVPVLNEEKAIPIFYNTIRGYSPLKPYTVEIVFINDGSRDNTETLINELSKQANIYSPIKFSRKVQGKDVEYIVSAPQGNYGLYGNLPWRKDMDAVVYKNKMKLTSYSRWLSPSVFYIPTEQKERTVNIKLKTKNGVDIKDEQFYALDLDLLKHVSRVVSSRQVTDLRIDRSDISCTADGKEGDCLFLSVPYHKGWTVTINGKVVLPELLGNCLMVLPLEKGVNRIQMHYRVPYVVEGGF